MFEYSKPTKLAVAILVCVVCAVPYDHYCKRRGLEARATAQAELDARTGFDHWRHNTDPEDAENGWKIAPLGVIPFLGWLTYIFAPLILAALAVIRGMLNALLRKLSVRKMDSKSRRETKQSTTTQARQEVVSRLGTIDQFVRVYRSESDGQRRLVALQAAHGEVTQLNAKWASGDLDASALTDPHVRTSLTETVNDLCQAGLGEDRLTRDLKRLLATTKVA